MWRVRCSTSFAMPYVFVWKSIYADKAKNYLSKLQKLSLKDSFVCSSHLLMPFQGVAKRHRSKTLERWNTWIFWSHHSELDRISISLEINSTYPGVLCDNGEKFVTPLYIGGSIVPDLSQRRYFHSISLKFVSVERMPPTSRACFCYSLQVQIQVSTWHHLKILHGKRNYRLYYKWSLVVSVITDPPAALPELLPDVHARAAKIFSQLTLVQNAGFHAICITYVKCSASKINIKWERSVVFAILNNH